MGKGGPSARVSAYTSQNLPSDQNLLQRRRFNDHWFVTSCITGGILNEGLTWNHGQCRFLQDIGEILTFSVRLLDLWRPDFVRTIMLKGPLLPGCFLAGWPLKGPRSENSQTGFGPAHSQLPPVVAGPESGSY